MNKIFLIIIFYALLSGCVEKDLFSKYIKPNDMEICYPKHNIDVIDSTNILNPPQYKDKL